MNERGKWESVKNGEGRKNYSRLKNERTKENENCNRQGQDGVP